MPALRSVRLLDQLRERIACVHYKQTLGCLEHSWTRPPRRNRSGGPSRSASTAAASRSAGAAAGAWHSARTRASSRLRRRSAASAPPLLSGRATRSSRCVTPQSIRLGAGTGGRTEIGKCTTVRVGPCVDLSAAGDFAGGAPRRRVDAATRTPPRTTSHPNPPNLSLLAWQNP